jgi:parallel beta-helix repeat protein
VRSTGTALLPFIGAIALLANEARSRTLSVPTDYKTIQAAIDAATTRDEVVVSAGTYNERIRLKPGLSLRSAGGSEKGAIGLKRAEQCVIDGRGVEKVATPGVIMAEGATLDGFTVTRVGKYDDANWNKHHATSGAEQAHEHIGGFGSPAIGADAVTCDILNNIVHHNGDTGIALRGDESKTVTPLVKGNVCYRNMGGGIGIMKGASGLITGNTCFENFYAGIGHSGASPLVEGNECYQNVRAGIGISEGACPVVRKNRCYNNRRAGIGIRSGKTTAPVVIDNDCFENGMAGIGIEDEAAPTIQNNRCVQNELAGIGSRANAQPLIVNNVCRANKAAGIGFEKCEKGVAVVKGNMLINNRLVAVGVQSGWDVELTGNTLSREGGLPPMVMVFENARCVLRRNTITGNGVAGVLVAGTAILSDNVLNGRTIRKSGPPHFGIWALAGSTVTVSNCKFQTWRHALYASGATVKATDNSARDIARVAFLIQKPTAPPHLIHNTLYSDDSKAVAVQAEGDGALVKSNPVKPIQQEKEKASPPPQ